MADEISAGKISIDFGADLSDLHAAFADARKSLNDLGGSLTKGTGAMGDFGAATSVAGGILAADFIKSALEAAKSIASFAFTVTESASAIVEGMDIVAQQTGLTLQQMQELEPVFRRNNLSAQSMGQVFRILARNINEARDPASQAGKAFRELGVGLTGLETPSQVFTLIAERISTLPNGFQKTRLETELLGRSGILLDAVMREGAEGLRRSADEARTMGNVLNTEANTALLKVNDSFDDLATASSNLQKHLAVLFAPFVQSVNEAHIALINFATGAIDQVIIASRTLAARFEALFGFLRAISQLSITDFAQVPEIWERWNHWATEQVDAIRKVGVVSQETANSIGQIDAKAQAAALALQRANEQASLSLTQVDMGWKIVEESLATYRLTQKAVIDDGAAAVTQFSAVDAAVRAVAESLDKAKVAQGGMTSVEFNQASAKRAVEGIQDQIKATQQLAGFKVQGFQQELAMASTTADRRTQLAFEIAAVERSAQSSVTVLQLQAEQAKLDAMARTKTFFQTQMQAIVDSNAFSVSQIVNSWTSGLANSIVKGGNFVKAAWESTQVAILQGALNMGVQLAAQWALRAAAEVGIATATAATVGAINAAKNSAIIAGETVTAGATVGIWAGAQAAIVATFVTMGVAIKLFFVETIVPLLVKVGTVIMTFLSAVAEGMASTIFGIPTAVAITIAVVGIGVAIAAAMGAFAKGGIVTGPTLGLMGEAGSAEAAIPLNDRGAAFMAKTMGFSRGAGGSTPTQQTIIVELNGAPIMKMVANGLPSMLRLKGLPA